MHGIDAAFLHTETRNTPWNVVGVLIFDPTTATEGFTREVVARVISERLDQVEPFARRIIDIRGAVSMPHWVRDQPVDLDQHVSPPDRPIRTGLAGLGEAAGRLASSPLPRDRPLWQVEVIDDIGDGRAAALAKVHHSMMDGVAAVETLGVLFDLEPRSPPALDAGARPHISSSRGVGLGSVLRDLARMPAVVARAASQVPSAGLGFLHALRAAGRSVTLPFTGPRTHFNRSITERRSVALTSLPLGEVRHVADNFGLTINDVLMTVCAGALRRWLQASGELSDRPLVAAVPVALRAEEHQVGNRLSVMFASLPTHLSDARMRLDFVAHGMRDAKATHADVRPRTLAALAEAMPWNVLGLLFRAYSDLGLATRLPPAVNLVVSNVPGPPVPVYCAGAKLVSLYALGPIFDGAGLNITFTSCTEEVDVGIVACPDVTPSVDGLVVALADALAELVELADSTDS